MSQRLPKRVRVTESFDGREIGEEYEVEGYVLAAGHIFYPIKQDKLTHAEDLLYGHKCEVIEYHEST